MQLTFLQLLRQSRGHRVQRQATVVNGNWEEGELGVKGEEGDPHMGQSPARLEIGDREVILSEQGQGQKNSPLNLVPRASH